MFQPWRFKLKEAEVALEQGRLEDAARLLKEGDLPTYLPAQQLLAQVAVKFGARATLRAKSGEQEAAWRDLEAARNLTGETTDWLTAHKAVTDFALEIVVSHLRGNDFEGAIAKLDKLEKRKPVSTSLSALREVARRLDSARKLSLRGKFADAEAQLLAAVSLQPSLSFITDQKQLCRERGERCRLLSEPLHRSLAASDWTAVVATADSLLEFAPENQVARDARKRAWNEVGAKVTDSRAGARAPHETQHWPGGETTKKSEEPEKPRGPRFLLWIDAVGGYLVCLSDEVIIGQAFPGSQADLAIQADI